MRKQKESSSRNPDPAGHSATNRQVKRRVYSDCCKILMPKTIGSAEIKIDTPSKLERMMGALHGQPLGRERYCRLLVNGSTVMTDAEFERRTNIDAILNAKGNALIAGLGIGLILKPFIDNCLTVTVIEKSKDVIELVGVKFPSITIIHTDIFEWLPPKGTKYDSIYFDIWPDICTDDLEEAKLLHKRFRKFLAREGFMQSWTRIANLYNRYK